MKIRIDKNNASIIILLFTYLTIGSVSKLLDNLLGVPKVVLYTLLLIMLVISTIYNFYSLELDSLFFYVLITPIFLFGIIKNYNIIGFENSSSMLLNVLPIYMIIRLFKNKFSKLETVFKWAIITNLLIYIPLSIGTNNYMDYSYNVVLNGCLAMIIYMQSKNRLFFLLFILSSCIAIMYGSRGGTLCVAVFLLYVSFKSLNKNNIKIFIIIIIILSLVIYNSDRIIELLHTLNINSRFIETLLSNDLTHSEGREKIYEYCQVLLSENKFGYGILSTRRLIPWQPYPHSIIYEILVDYGFIIGVPLLLFIFIIGIKLIISDTKESWLGSCYWILGITMLMISGSIYYNPYLFISFALYMNQKNKKMVVI